jgi:hypothetical protein
VAIGHRLGSVALPFAAISGVMFHERASATAPQMLLSGLVLHTLAIFLWGVICMWLARGLSHRLVAAALVASLQFTLSWIVAWSSGNGLASVLALGDRIVYTVILASALAVGMRFAFPQRGMHDRALL